MQDRDLYAKLLDLNRPWDVVDVNVDMKARSVVVSVAHRSDVATRCPECEDDCPRHDTRRRSWRHLDTMQYKTVLTAEVPRIKCKKHGVKQVKVPWAEARSRFTALFECLVIDWLQQGSIKAVAELLDLSWEQVSGIMERAVERGLARRKLQIPEIVGIDETSFQKRHEYVTVVCSPANGQVLYVADGRSAKSLDGFFDPLSPQQRAAIQAVAMDMSGSYLSAVRKALGPNADERIVFDKFHIAGHLGDAVNKVRRQEHRILLEKGDERLKGTRYLWLMNPANMSKRQWSELADIKASNLKVGRAWAIKETTMAVFDIEDPQDGEVALKQALGWISRCRLVPMMRVGRTLREHFAGVMNAIISGITNATSEAINARIQWLKKKANGFRSRERFRMAIYFHLGGLQLYPGAAASHPIP